MSTLTGSGWNTKTLRVKGHTEEIIAPMLRKSTCIMPDAWYAGSPVMYQPCNQTPTLTIFLSCV